MKEYPLPLFHGTDKKILAMSYEERDALANICDHIADTTDSEHLQQENHDMWCFGIKCLDYKAPHIM